MEKRHLTDFIWRSRSCRAALFLLAALGFAFGQTAWGTEKGFETPPTLKAGGVLAAELLKGNRYRIEETVPTDGFLMKFTIVSDFGTFIARSPGMAETRVTEIEALEKLEKVSKTEAFSAFAGGLGVAAFKAVVPVGVVVSTSTMLSDLVWDIPPGDLKVQNERSLVAMGVSQEQVDLLLRQPYFTLTLQARLVKALERLKKTTGRPWIMPVATTVLSFDQARFVVEAMEMLAGYGEKISPIIALENKAPFAGRTASGTLVVAGPVDLLAWTERINLFAVRPDLKAKEKILWLRGEATPEARQQLTKLDCQGSFG